MNFIVFMAMVTVLVIPASLAFPQQTNEIQTYIVRLEEPETGPLGFDERRKWYASFLPKSPREAQNCRLLHAYEHVMSGFAARLTNRAVEAMRNLPGFVQAYPDTVLHLQTTYTPQFLGLQPGKGLWGTSNMGKGVIIALFDTGVWPESPSFGDHGMPAAPARWKGICQSAPDFNSSVCNNKLIGARVVIAQEQSDYLTPRDSDGHGTHTASTAAGNSVDDADLFGNAKGTARGLAPAAHIAMYKVCSKGGCSTSDVLAAMDQAIADGVDVMSLSIGGGSPPLYEDLIAAGAFHAMERGIFVACAGGNSGPDASSVSNSAPWITTVGASTSDRRFVANVKLGDGLVLYGESLFYSNNNSNSKQLPLVDGGQCYKNSFHPVHVKGKLVVCEPNFGVRSVEQGEIVRDEGGAGMIFVDRGAVSDEIVPRPHVFPATQLHIKAGEALQQYMVSTQSPTAAILFEGTVFEANISAPSVASFSSRGPSIQSPDILKPDVIAPGLSILAAWPSNVGPAEIPADHRSVMFSILSGTSMACPHVSGLAALLKSAHPDWSPAAIKSALMTTADIVDRKGRPIVDGGKNYTSAADVFATGAGHVNPERAADPGLIYDITSQDYIYYLCGLNYTAAQIRAIVNRNVVCPTNESTLPGNLNYPSFSVRIPTASLALTFRRTVTNVGPASSSYTVNVVEPSGLKVTVNPTSLSFTGVGEKKSYNVTFAGNKNNGSDSQGYLEWVSGSSSHRVRSPISIIPG